MPLISAHRGGAPVAGQTAADRYRHAIDIGADFVEFDVRKTQDRVAVVFHDEHLPDGTRIGDLSYGEMAARLGGEALTLDELLDIAAGKVGMHLDLKEAGYEAELIAAVRQRTHDDRFVITSEDRIVRTVKDSFPEVRAGLSLGDELAGAPPWRRLAVRLSEAFPGERLEKSRADFVAAHWQLADFNVLRYCARHAIPAWVWTVDEEAAIRRYLADPRVAVIITNRPELALQLRTARA